MISFVTGLRRELGAEFGGLGDGVVERDVELVGNHLGQAVGLGVGQVVDAGDVADDHLGAERAVGDDVGHAVVAVLPAHVIDHFAAAAHAEVDVEIGRGNALGIEEALEEELEAERVEVGDAQQIGDEAAGAGAAARADRDALFLGPANEVPDDEEIVGVAGLLDDGEFVVGPVAKLRRELGAGFGERDFERRIGGRGARGEVDAVAAAQPVEGILPEVARPGRS